jgi:hypothetical protein
MTIQKSVKPDDKRTTKRKKLVYYMKIINRDTNKPFGKLVDLTSEGIMITSENPIEVNQVFHLKLHLPPEFSSRKFIVLEVKSCWCRPEVGHGQYGAGFQLINVSGVNLDLIKRLIREYS